MEDEAAIKEVINGNDEKSIKEEIFTKIVRAGKRTYFFDVKATRKEDYYLTITESKKRAGKEGKIFYEKHKIFLYKEDFQKFAEGLKDAVKYIEDGRVEIRIPEVPPQPGSDVINGSDDVNGTDDVNGSDSGLNTTRFSNVDFDDLGKQ
jgi:hypothetical protein